MTSPRGRVVTRVLGLQGLGFVLVLVIICLNELLDLPHAWLGAPRTPVNVHELALESLAVVALAVVVLWWTARVLRRMQMLEGILSICSFCKRIRVGEQEARWVPVEQYVTEHSAALFSHGLCEACARKHYGEELAAG